jgi:hypothetical protein
MDDVHETMKKETLKLQAIAKEAKLELTPELRMFAWLIKHHALIDFWESAKRQVEYQQDVLGKALEKNNAT